MTVTMKNPEFSDAARRIADSMTLHSIASTPGHWAVYRLSDGTTDNVAYEKRTDAVKAMRWDRDNYLYLEIQPDGMTPKAAQACLNYARFLHDQGWRLPDPEFDFDASVPTYSWDQLKMVRHLISGGRK